VSHANFAVYNLRPFPQASSLRKLTLLQPNVDLNHHLSVSLPPGPTSSALQKWEAEPLLSHKVLPKKRLSVETKKKRKSNNSALHKYAHVLYVCGYEKLSYNGDINYELLVIQKRCNYRHMLF
jgi:hypothetical protein